MSTQRGRSPIPGYGAAIRGYVKRQPALRKPAVTLRASWHRLKYLYLVLGRNGERKIAEEAMPVLRHFSRGSCSIAKEMRAAYREYTDTVSYEGMPISFQSACFLWSVCEALKPGRILDMGSGFSSFVFRRYQATATSRPEVWSVDERAEWLEKTRAYLRSHGLSEEHLYTWDAFQELEPPRFDLMSHDMGYMNERPDTFEWMLSLRETGGIIVLDDFHHPEYRAEITRRLREQDTVSGYPLRWLTLDRFLRYSLLVRQGGPNRAS